MCRLEKYITQELMSSATGQVSINKVDQLRRVEIIFLRSDVLPIVAVLYGKYLTDACSVPAEDSARQTASVLERLSRSSRKEVFEFLECQVGLFRTFSERANPHSHELDVGLATRKFHLMSYVFERVSSDINGELVSDIVDVYLNTEHMDFSGVSVIEH